MDILGAAIIKNVNEEIKGKAIFAENCVYNISRLFDRWALFDHLFRKKCNEVPLLVINWDLDVASQVAEVLKI